MSFRVFCISTILDRRVLDNLILADKLFTKTLRGLEFCVLFNNKLHRKLVSLLESPITFDERFKFTWVPLIIPGFHVLSCILGNFTFKMLDWVILYWFYFKAKWNDNTLTVSGEKSKMVSFASSLMRNFVVSPFRRRVPVTLSCCIALGSVSNACCLLKSVAIIL